MLLQHRFFEWSMPGIDFISLLPNLMLPVCVSEVRLSLILFFIFAEDSFLPGLPPDFDWDDLGLVFGLFPGLTDDFRDDLGLVFGLFPGLTDDLRDDGRRHHIFTG